ncbi:hypothetical protein C5167_003530 [Papaver somniferum]|uniref:Uncharacterized protein n=1 Tax=Papaver somniferum TaxID=3469 RepID=A0A4Y7L4F9_PAPSO|nr:hypothetical protein C5167_003530 [Papaver somniferum]
MKFRRQSLGGKFNYKDDAEDLGRRGKEEQGILGMHYQSSVELVPCNISSQILGYVEALTNTCSNVRG